MELRNRAAAIELERNSTKFGSSLSRSRSAQSLKLLGDTATQVGGFVAHYYDTYCYYHHIHTHGLSKHD